MAESNNVTPSALFQSIQEFNFNKADQYGKFSVQRGQWTAKGNSVVTHIIELLASFIGVDTTDRAARKIFRQIDQAALHEMPDQTRLNQMVAGLSDDARVEFQFFVDHADMKYGLASKAMKQSFPNIEIALAMANEALNPTPLPEAVPAWADDLESDIE